PFRRPEGPPFRGGRVAPARVRPPQDPTGRFCTAVPPAAPAHRLAHVFLEVTMLRKPLLLAARSQTARTVVERTPMTRAMVDRFVAGADLQGALPTVADVTTD